MILTSYNACTGVDCRLPEVIIELEFTDYSLRETMGNALQVCAVAANVAFPVKAEFLVLNGRAIGN